MNREPDDPMMSICVYINGRQIAEATARNLSDLASISDYECTGHEWKSDLTPGLYREFRIDGHPRKQTCWALVEKIAKALTHSRPHQNTPNE